MSDLPTLDIYLYGLSGVVIRSVRLSAGQTQLHIGRPGRLGLKRNEDGDLEPDAKHKHGPGGSFDGHLRCVAVAGGWWSSPDHSLPQVGVCPKCGGESVVIDGEHQCLACDR